MVGVVIFPLAGFSLVVLAAFAAIMGVRDWRERRAARQARR